MAIIKSFVTEALYDLSKLVYGYLNEGDCYRGLFATVTAIWNWWCKPVYTLDFKKYF